MTKPIGRDTIYRCRRFSAETIELCVRWYITYRLSYRDLAAMIYAYSVSWEDIVYAPYDPLEERPTIQRVIKKSGNRTVRVKFDPPVEDGNSSDQLLQGLIALGCSS